MNAIYELSVRHIEQLHALYQQEWWTKGRSLENTRRGIEGSQICIGITDENNDLQGFSRVLTDFIFKALLFDIIVAKTYRGKGLGDQLMSAIRTHPKLKTVKHFELYCLPELAQFYRKYGFTNDVDDIQLMKCEI